MESAGCEDSFIARATTLLHQVLSCTSLWTFLSDMAQNSMSKVAVWCVVVFALNTHALHHDMARSDVMIPCCKHRF